MIFSEMVIIFVMTNGAQVLLSEKEILLKE